MALLDTTARPRRPRPSPAARRAGYVVGAAVNVVLLLLVNVWPGWEVLPFLTPAIADALYLVNASIVVGIAADLVYVVADPPRLRAAGDVIVTGTGLLALAALWRTFPFSFSGRSIDWETVVRILLGLGIVGSAVSIVVSLVALVTSRTSRPSADR